MNDLTNDLLNPLKSNISDGFSRRVGDPIISTYSISFVIWNYETWFILFSNLPPQEKLELTAQHLHTWQAFIFPLAITAFILFGLPYLFNRPYKWIENNRVKLKNFRVEAERELISHKLEIEQLESRLQNEIKRADKARNELSSKDNELGELKNQINELKNRITERDILSQQDNDNSSNRSPDSFVNRAIASLRKTGIENEFKRIAASAVTKGIKMENIRSEDAVRLIAFGLIGREDSKLLGGPPEAVLTDLGKRVLQFIMERGT